MAPPLKTRDAIGFSRRHGRGGVQPRERLPWCCAKRDTAVTRARRRSSRRAGRGSRGREQPPGGSPRRSLGWGAGRSPAYWSSGGPPNQSETIVSRPPANGCRGAARSVIQPRHGRGGGPAGGLGAGPWGANSPRAVLQGRALDGGQRRSWRRWLETFNLTPMNGPNEGLRAMPQAGVTVSYSGFPALVRSVEKVLEKYPENMPGCL